MSCNPQSATALAVIVPVRDRPEQLRRATDSILRESTTGVCVVIVDDGSATPVDAAQFNDDRIRVARTTGVGAAAARNVGIEAADEATWVTFLDSDDEAKAGWIDAILAAQHAGADLFSCGADYHWAHGDKGLAALKPMWRGDASPRALFLAGTFAVKRELIVEVGGYRPGLRHGENTELGWRLGGALRRSGAAVISTDEPLVAINAVRKQVPPLVLLESAQTVLADPPELLRENRAEMANLLAVAGVAASRLGQRSTARHLMMRSALQRPMWPKGWGRVVRAVTFGWPPLTP